MNAPRVGRPIKLLRLLQSTHRFDLGALAADLEVSRRTVFRDLNLLKDAGLPIEYDSAGRHYRLLHLTPLPPLNFSEQEALALLMLGHQARQRAQVPLQRAAASAAIKLESNLPQHLLTPLHGLTDSASFNDESLVLRPAEEAACRALLQAAAESRCVRIQYESVSDGEICTKLSPYKLLFSRHAWYVIGRSSLHRQVRTFHVGRIQRVEPLDESFRPSPGFSIDRYLRHAWHLIPEPGPDWHVHLKFSARVARHVEDVIWHKTQRTRSAADGTLDFYVTVSGLGEIFWWVLGYGDQVRVVGPRKLREMVAERLRKAYLQYEGSGSTSQLRRPR